MHHDKIIGFLFSNSFVFMLTVKIEQIKYCI